MIRVGAARRNVHTYFLFCAGTVALPAAGLGLILSRFVCLGVLKLLEVVLDGATSLDLYYSNTALAMHRSATEYLAAPGWGALAVIALGTLAPAPASPTQTTYFSVSPYRFGAANAKFRVAPDPQSCPEYVLPPQNQNLPNFLRSALNQQLSTDRVPACFVLQFPRQNPQKFMPLADTSIAWKESDAPYETVARVKIPPQDFDTPALNLACDNQSFNPWFGLEAHRPIGGINRLRKAVYEAVSDYRHSRNL